MEGSQEGLRQRKRRQTREKIEQVALALFLEKGFDAVTVDEIAAMADVSRRSFFDYFSRKEDVVYAWQLHYAAVLVEAIASRPTDEPLRRTVEAAVTSSISASRSERDLALGKLVAETPALQRRDQILFSTLERVLAEALAARYPQSDAVEVRIVAMAGIGALRIGREIAEQDPFEGISDSLIASLFRMLWSADGVVRE